MKHISLIVFLCIMPSLVYASAETQKKPKLKIELHGICQSLRLEQAVEVLKRGKKEQATYDMEPVTIRVQDEARNRLFSCELKAYFPAGNNKKGVEYLLALLDEAAKAIKCIQEEERTSALAKLDKEIAENQKAAQSLAAQKAALLEQASHKTADSKAEFSINTK